MEQFNNATIAWTTVARSGTNGIHADRSHATINHSVVMDNLAHGLSVDNFGSLNVSYSTIIENKHAGIGCGAGNPSVQLTFSTVTNNEIGIIAHTFSNLIANYNNIYRNRMAEIDITSSSLDADARYNWWGTTNESIIRRGILDHHTDLSTPGVVHYKPYLDSVIEKNPVTNEEITSKVSYDFKDEYKYKSLNNYNLG